MNPQEISVEVAAVAVREVSEVEGALRESVSLEEEAARQTFRNRTPAEAYMCMEVER